MSLSYEAGPTDTPILEETIGANLERTAARYGDVEALVDVEQGLRYTYAEFNAEVDVVARGLMAKGIAKGDRVGIWAPNCAQWTIAQYACAKTGAILVNINPAYRTHELGYVLTQSGTRLLIAATSFKTSDYVAMVAGVRGDVPTLTDVVFIGTPDWDALRAGASAVGADELAHRGAALDNRDPINIQYTSGTTGFPKGATLSHRNILNNGYFTTELIGLGPQDRLCIPVPFYHCYGILRACAECGRLSERGCRRSRTTARNRIRRREAKAPLTRSHKAGRWLGPSKISTCPRSRNRRGNVRTSRSGSLTLQAAGML